MALLAGCGGSASADRDAGSSASVPAPATTVPIGPGARAPILPLDLAAVRLPPISTAPRDRYPPALSGRWQVISEIAGVPALWIARRDGVTLVRMDQRLVHLVLHAGAADPGGSGWRYGDQITGAELGRVIMAFNGGFKFNVPAGGFESFGRTGVPLVPGFGSVITYRDGHTDIRAWGPAFQAQLPSIASVRQNLRLLIYDGAVNPSVSACGAGCWGVTVGGAAVARSGLGVTRSGRQLIWAGGEGLTVAQLAGALLGAGAWRAVQLDINPAWVAGYLYVHHHGQLPTPVPVVPGQTGIYGQLLLPYSRDFFAVLSNWGG